MQNAQTIHQASHYDKQMLSMHLDMTKTLKMLYGRNFAEDYFLKHLKSCQLPDNLRSA